MSTKYKFLDNDGLYFVSFATVSWVDVFTRLLYKDIFCESIQYCQQNKGLHLHAWCLMSNHVHLVFSRSGLYSHSDILRDLKKFTSKRLIEAIENNPAESRKEWMMSIFRNAGQKKSNNKDYQFWQQDNHPIELFSPLVTFQKIDYVHNNPLAAGIVSESEHYLHSSARDYAGIKGILNVEILERPGSLEGYVFSY
ncbi:MAG: transposase [Saprospiraceae bacterium]|nr:transposase [Saprospiraceae bacterium]